MTERIVCWFSCGAASAVATKLAIAQNAGKKPLVIVYTAVKEEHPDNARFLKDCEKWFNYPITVIENEKYGGSIVKVFDAVKFMGGIAGAPCTMHLKKDMRRKFEQPGDINVFGYTAEESDRINRWIDSNADKKIWDILGESGLTHEDCLGMIHRAGIELPVMYKLGYKHNNCIGCVKGGVGYWNKIRKDFPEVFAQRVEQEQRIGARLIKINEERTSLANLPPDAGSYETEPEIQCGIMCELAYSQT